MAQRVEGHPLYEGLSSEEIIEKLDKKVAVLRKAASDALDSIEQEYNGKASPFPVNNVERAMILLQDAIKTTGDGYSTFDDGSPC